MVCLYTIIKFEKIIFYCISREIWLIRLICLIRWYKYVDWQRKIFNLLNKELVSLLRLVHFSNWCNYIEIHFFVSLTIMRQYNHPSVEKDFGPASHDFYISLYVSVWLVKLLNDFTINACEGWVHGNYHVNTETSHLFSGNWHAMWQLDCCTMQLILGSQS